jgi:hypothetical protein
LQQAGERDRLRACLLDIDQFLLIKERDENELLHFWVWLEQEQVIGKICLEAFDRWSQGCEDSLAAYAANNLGTFMFIASIYEGAEPLMRRALAIDEENYSKVHCRVA